MSLSVRYGSLSSAESYYPNIVRTLWVGGRSMSPSNKLVVVFPIKRTYPPVSYKNKGSASAALLIDLDDESFADSDDESFAAFAKFSKG